MRVRVFFAIILAMVLPGTAPLADLRHSGDPPTFTVEEQAIIRRNAALVALADRDPWLVRQVLDAITAAARQSKNEPGPDRAGRMALEREPAPEPARNPDLEQFGRASPEAAHDLFQLIKKASAGTKRSGTQ
jgi:hypothetical protein